MGKRPRPFTDAVLIIDEIRARKGISKEELARRLHTHSANARRVCRPGLNPRFSDLKRYARALGVRVRDLIRE